MPGKKYFMRTLVKSSAITYCLIISFYARAQSSLASAQLKTLRGTIVSFSSATQKDSLVLVCFWATTSDVSITELNAINSKYEKWKGSLSFKLMAVAVDEGKDANRVRGMVNMNEWKFDVYTDIKGDLRSALNSNNLPQAMIIKNNKVIYQQSGYEAGTEDYLFQKMRTIAQGKL
jgi:cytochrome c biogenesis protein CcmG/thiol:disulfide interchange protein DsbE